MIEALGEANAIDAVLGPPKGMHECLLHSAKSRKKLGFKDISTSFRTCSTNQAFHVERHGSTG